MNYYTHHPYPPRRDNHMINRCSFCGKSIEEPVYHKRRGTIRSICDNCGNILGEHEI
jgi:ribosome-binding protein aMBF1 (putative translation factor)